VKFVSRVCKKCGAKILADVTEGLCTACLIETGLSAFDGASAPPQKRGDPGWASKLSRTDGNGAPRPEETTFAAKVLGALGEYELLEEIGRGGQAVVYRARQKNLNRTVALKVIRARQWTSNERLNRFWLEAETAASLDHPSIVPIYEVGERDGSCYFSMKLIEGGRLDEALKREPIPMRRTAELIAKLARAVQYAHERGILHRDIKPGNILLDAKGEPHLTDFGIARLIEVESTVTRTLETLGTPSYMAPEQALRNEAQLTSATDVYGLGAVFYHLLTGHPPFAGPTTYETIRLLLETEPRQPRLWNPKMDRDLTTICLKCLEKNPQRRYCSALALAEDLERWLRHEPVQARHTGFLIRANKWMHRKPLAAGLIASLVALAAAIGVIFSKTDLVRRPVTTGIAVLPFENLSEDKENASFADGVQDDILTKLARIADLKVISRTSVMQYRGNQNAREIGKALRVSHVLEGSVRKAGARLHMNAQLIDTRTDTHVWAEQYDCDLNDLFAVQSKIAQKIAQDLHAKISATEKQAIERPPTIDLTAFDLYTRAQNLLLVTSFGGSARANLLEATDLLRQAVAVDPSFFQAYCQLAHAHLELYFHGHDHTPLRLALAEAAVQKAFALRPDAGEAHLARAENLYRAHLDYEGALAELELAGQTLPNDPQVFALKGYIERRRDRQEQALHNLERAVDLDPSNVFTLQQIAISYGFLRRYAEEKSVLDRVLAIEPNDVDTRVVRALVEFDWKADTRLLHDTIESIRAANPAAMPSVGDAWLICALAERDAAAAENALVVAGEPPWSDDIVQFNRPFIEGIIAHMMQDDGKARSAFAAARIEQEKMIQAQPNYGPPLCVLGLIDADLGRKEDALREAARAVELLPVKKDALSGTRMILYSAMIAAWAGYKDVACEQLAVAIRPPTPISYGQLKLLPFWDALRGDPRFEKIVASLAPR
jgi:serine/threonine protein kinase/Tfp pilus assembly protein PilF